MHARGKILWNITYKVQNNCPLKRRFIHALKKIVPSPKELTLDTKNISIKKRGLIFAIREAERVQNLCRKGPFTKQQKARGSLNDV